MSNAPSFLLNRGPTSPPQVQSGTIVKIDAQSVTIDTGSGRVPIPMTQLQLNGRTPQAQELKVHMQCVQECGVWQIQSSGPSPMKPGFNSQMGPKAGPGLPPPIPKPGFGGPSSSPPPPMPKPGQGLSPPMPNIAQPGALGGPKQGMMAMPQIGNMQPMPSVPPKIGLSSKPGVIPKVGMNPASNVPAKIGMQGPKANLGVSYQVMKLENQQATIKIENSSRTIPFSCFYDPTQLGIGSSVRTDDGNKWTVVAAMVPPRPVLSQPQVQPVQSKELRQQGSGVFKIVKVQSNGVTAQEDNFPQVEVPLACIFSQDGQNVTARQLKVHLNMQIYPDGKFVVLCDLPPDLQPFQQFAALPTVPTYCLPILALDSVYPGLETQSYQVLKDYAANKYGELYFNRNGSPVRSVACYLVQCALFENTLYQEEAATIRQPITQKQQEALQATMRISSAFGLRGLMGGVFLKDPTFEETYGGAIDVVEARVQTILTGQSGINYYQVAEQLQVCLTVLLPNTSSNFDKYTFFPPSYPEDTKWQQLVMIGQPPYPVLIQKKLQPLLVEGAQVTGVKFKYYLYKSPKVKPPEIDPNLVRQLKQVGATDGELIPLASSLLRFSSDMLARFNDLVSQQSLDKYPSSEMGMALHSLHQHAQGLREVCRDPQLNEEVAGLAQNVEREVWNLFTHKCVCGGGFVDVMLECGHGLCKREFADMVLQMRQRGGKMINKADGTTMMTCPVDNIPVTVASLQAYSESLVDELVKEGNARSGLASCNTCQKACSAKILVNTVCGHQMCGSCFNNPFPACKICNTRLDSMLMSLNSWTPQCDACQYQFDWKMISPGSCERGHVLCPNCCFRAVKSQSCAVYGCAELTSEGLALMKTKAMVACQACGLSKMITSFAELPCTCAICEKCTILKVKETSNYLCCWFCRTPFSQALGLSLYDKAGLGTASPCVFCGEYLTETEGGIKLVCGDSTHQHCLNVYANQCIHSNPSTRVICPSDGIEIYADNFMEWFDYRASSELACFFQQNPLQYEASCPRCGSDSEVLQISRKLNTSQSATCSRCGCIYCVLCLDQATDQFHAGGTCKYLVARNQTKELETEKKKAVQCPRCLLVQEKGQGWQECLFCKWYFCAECVVAYEVINSHGHCYHREDCPNYSLHDLKSGTFCPECPSCNVKGGDDACDKPQKLARQGQFAPWEKPKTAGEVNAP